MRIEDLPAVPNDDEDNLHAILESDDLNECVYLANKEDIVECRLSPEQRRLFNLAKDEALQPWIDNRAWEAVDSAEARPEESCPLRFWLKWKLKDGSRRPAPESSCRASSCRR